MKLFVWIFNCGKNFPQRALPPPCCRQCGQSPPTVVLAAGAELCADCSQLTEAEQAQFERNRLGVDRPRRRDDPKF